MAKKEYDAVIVGAGPNGLAAAITLQQAGLSVLLIEGRGKIGGGLRSEALTLPGFLHDVCSAIHPMALASPFFRSLPLADFGLEFIQPPVAAAHPFDGGSAALLHRSVVETASAFGIDEKAYLKLIQPLTAGFSGLVNDILAPLHLPDNIWQFTKFGLNALQPASMLAGRFRSKEAKGLWGGMAAHSMLPLDKLTTAAIGLVLLSAGHAHGWPIPKGGSNQIATALAAYFQSLGGQIETGIYIKSLQQLPSSTAVLFDVTPRQLLQIAGHTFSSVYQSQLKRYRYGMGVFKVDWALAEPVPFTNSGCRQAGTVHIGGTFEEVANAEKMNWAGKHPDKPFVLLAQQSIFDTTRAPEGKQTLWGYCHVPANSTLDMTDRIEQQIERFAPGFRDRILARHTMNTAQMEDYNPNYIGGDINGGAQTLSQLFTRPALRWSPYRTSTKGLYICSSSTPPGGGVHGMCGYHAAQRFLEDLFPQHS
ncbi:NAD(P)/FAD-dependent oxidoreductase [Emticicia sp. 21SJ11W-3]|uniref:phytoene desaturase family protein n=1 Tax=Emticicia sp. 21SJ11W-3 TaxID=2916755 RepID=UPI0020A12064|nr:NAD(P)/FAD-dependent oxidoreductase [Emticicia sp. 21SJ11W-3]UTA70004.1 NAD(P)/FAD-dependent oxidoreductase [Emticicia sp. 21SJ11W-3]